MKKLIFLSILGLTLSLNAQNISKNAIGLRFGDNYGFGAEVSYQLKLQKNNRLELDLGWRNNDNLNFIKGTGLYQWVLNIEGDFNWYAGVGGGLGSLSYSGYKKNNLLYVGGGTYAFLAGNLGIEYDFDFPLLVSLDFRPE